MKMKVENVGRDGAPARVAFLATLLRCQGRVYAPPPTHSPEAFSGYITAHGTEAFGEVRQELTASGVVVATDTHLTLNYAASQEGFGTLVRECSDTLWRAGFGFFAEVLRGLMSTPDGQFALPSLAKSENEEASVGYIASVVGSESWRAISEKLAWAGLFAVSGWTNKHTSYTMFPPLRDFLLVKDVQLRDAVAQVYVGQSASEKTTECSGLIWTRCIARWQVTLRFWASWREHRGTRCRFAGRRLPAMRLPKRWWAKDSRGILH